MSYSVYSVRKLVSTLTVVALATGFAIQADAQVRVQRPTQQQPITTRPALELKVNRIEQADSTKLPVIALKASRTHLLFILEPKGTGYVVFMLKSSFDFTFYAAEISKL